MRGGGRRVERAPVVAPVELGFDSSAGLGYARGKTIDVTAEGLQAEVSTEIRSGTEVSVRVEALKIAVRGVVRHCARRGIKFRVGIEFREPVKLS